MNILFRIESLVKTNTYINLHIHNNKQYVFIIQLDNI